MGVEYKREERYETLDLVCGIVHSKEMTSHSSVTISRQFPTCIHSYMNELVL